MSIGPKQRELAAILVRLTFREMQDFADAIGGNPENISDWAEKEMNPLPPLESSAL